MLQVMLKTHTMWMLAKLPCTPCQGTSAHVRFAFKQSIEGSSLRATPILIATQYARVIQVLLGIIHRAAIGRGPEQLRARFIADMDARREGRGKHRLTLMLLQNHASDFGLPRSAPAKYIEHSAYGLIEVYNMLPASIVEASPTVREFQRALQSLVKHRANAGCTDWEMTLSPRIPLYRHPLRHLGIQSGIQCL